MLLELLPQRLAVMRLSPGDSLPEWATKGSFFSITHTPDELSIFCDSSVNYLPIVDAVGGQANPGFFDFHP